jgi:hypothetical protein
MVLVWVLAQEEDGQVHPIAYASCTLDSHEKNYGISELQKSWSCVGSQVLPSIRIRTTVYIDHAACTSLLNSFSTSISQTGEMGTYDSGDGSIDGT